MYDQEQKTKKRQTIILIVLAILIVGLLIALFFITNDNKKLTFTIKNKSDFFTSATKIDLNNLEYSLLSYEKEYYKIKSPVVAEVRPESYDEFLDKNIYNSTFLLDIPALLQTLKVTFTYSSENSVAFAVDITCPSKSETHYENFACIDSITGKTEDEKTEEEKKPTPPTILGLDYLRKRGVSSANQSAIYKYIENFFMEDSSVTRLTFVEDSYAYDQTDRTITTFEIKSNTDTVYIVTVHSYPDKSPDITIKEK